MSEHGIQVVLTNETQGYRFSEWTEDLDDVLSNLVNEDGTPNLGAIYRHSLREYGACKSKIYVDKTDGEVRHIGWYFEKRAQYDDAPTSCRDCGAHFGPKTRHWCDVSGRRSEPDDRSYLQGAWVTIVRRRDDYQPSVWGAA